MIKCSKPIISLPISNFSLVTALKSFELRISSVNVNKSAVVEKTPIYFFTNFRKSSKRHTSLPKCCQVFSLSFCGKWSIRFLTCYVCWCGYIFLSLSGLSGGGTLSLATSIFKYRNQLATSLKGNVNL